MLDEDQELTFGGLPILARNGHAAVVAACPLSGVNRTLWVHRGIDAFDPQETCGKS